MFRFLYHIEDVFHHLQFQMSIDCLDRCQITYEIHYLIYFKPIAAG